MILEGSLPLGVEHLRKAGLWSFLLARLVSFQPHSGSLCAVRADGAAVADRIVGYSCFESLF